MMARGLADGLLILLPREPEAYLRSLRQRDFPYVLIDQFGIDDSDLTVTAANLEGGYKATSHLIELGHRRIGIITGWMDMVSARDRLNGYLKALADNNIPYEDELVYEGNFTQLSGFHGTNHLFDLANPPTAIFASSDLTAMGVMDAVRGRNLTIPTDLSVVGFDDVPMSSVLLPKLTTVRQPLVKMGQEATQMLLELIQKPEEKKSSIVLPTKLIVRESTAPLNSKL
jgi:LacI family transcriptional regulator